MTTAIINNVSDTALWVAAFRAQESDRPDAVFKDPLAKKLAGARGTEIARTTPYAKAVYFALVVRTSAIDKLIQIAIARGIDTVINLGAGLDTRPYRMILPANLRWIEVDFPHMIDYKNETLATEQPVCILQRLAADLSQDEERKQLFAQLNTQSKKALVITEGVIGYLTNQQAENLSKDLFATPNFYYWIQDYNQGKMRRHRRAKALRKKLANAPLQFDMPNPIGFFTQHGWKVHENRFILDEADRIGRKLPMLFPWNLLMWLFRKKFRALGNKTYGYVMYGR
jgi:methyltransferase (TIGR00027 family)